MNISDFLIVIGAMMVTAGSIIIVGVFLKHLHDRDKK